MKSKMWSLNNLSKWHCQINKLVAHKLWQQLGAFKQTWDWLNYRTIPPSRNKYTETPWKKLSIKMINCDILPLKKFKWAQTSTIKYLIPRKRTWTHKNKPSKLCWTKWTPPLIKQKTKQIWQKNIAKLFLGKHLPSKVTQWRFPTQEAKKLYHLLAVMTLKACLPWILCAMEKNSPCVLVAV